ncbi:hypothetical protein MKW92_031621 [Papaver armeniacum]|nr:hypothetical protein MKW92_031621 [Papaver armeniacum]
MASGTFQFPGFDFAKGATPRMYKFSEFTEEIDFSEVGTKPWEPFDFSKLGTKVTPIEEEEEEDVLIDLKAKLYRFDKDGNQWNYIKLLKHKQTEKIRLVMRQSGTLEVIANHLVLPKILIQEYGCWKSYIWHASDYSGGELKEEVFCA